TAVRDHHEDRADDAHEQVAADEEPGRILERTWDGDGHAQCREHEHSAKQLDLCATGVEPVHRPGRVVPTPPHRGEHHDGLCGPLPGEMLDQQVRQLDDREDVDQVEEELDGGHLGAAVPGAGECSGGHRGYLRVVGKAVVAHLERASGC